MSEKMYRRNEDGVMVEAAPEARAKAAAHDSYFAKAGRLGRHSKRYVSGKFKGKTYDEAKQEFEGKWAKAPGEVKDKYAKKGDYDLAPIERKRQGIPGLPGQEGPPPVTNASLNNNPRVIAKANANRASAVDAANREAAKERRVGNGTPVSPERKAEAAAEKLPGAGAPASPSPTKGEITEVGTPEERARAQAMLDVGSQYATAGRGNDVANKAIVAQAAAQERAEAAKANEAATAKRALEIAAQRSSPRTATGTAKTVGSVADPSTVTPAGPAKPLAPATPTPRSPAAVASDAAYGKIADERKAAGYPQAGQPSQSATPTRAASDAAYAKEADERKAAGYPPTPEQQAAAVAPAPEITGKRLIPGIAPKGINPLTKLPFGYVPGDAQAEGGPAIDKVAASDSMQRQRQASAAAEAAKPIPKATLAPAPVRYADAQRQYQEADPENQAEKGRAMDAIASSASSMDQAIIAGESMRRSAGIETINEATPRAKVVSETPRTPTNAVPMPQRAKLPGVQKPRFALARR